MSLPGSPTKTVGSPSWSFDQRHKPSTSGKDLELTDAQHLLSDRMALNTKACDSWRYDTYHPLKTERANASGMDH